ncbi:sensor histidine kinase [Amycolatopsis suaedae]|uniref:histidine kinase n=1 Tax=Amycolatopsis suaedae TaxID=2510978 RepID=A0A4Q7J6Q7_9PSEU|nr:histidine kinase [Amycolatopsis suaedae]RZQ62819.1 sensor histidine kinase [Amycolatopsis suaedae]
MTLWRRLLTGDPETGPLVRVLVTAVLAVALLAGGPREPWVWVLAAIAFGCWLFWAVFDGRLGWAPLAALAACSLLSTGTIGRADSGAATMAFVALLALASHLRPPTWLILGVLAADLVLLGVVAPHWTAATYGLAGLLLVLTLFGLNRRQYRSRVRQTEELLEQTRRVQEERAKAAALDERTRIAREMHDVLAHSLGALSVQLEVAEALLSERGDVGAALDRVRRSRRLAVDGLDEARRAVAALRTDVRPLPEALGELVEAFRLDHPSPITLRTAGTPRPVSAAAGVALLATAREALTNAVKHAPEAAVTVVLDYSGDTVSLEVANPAPPEAGAGGYGLTGMRERIALAGGTLAAGPVAAGWRVFAEVPR